MAGVFNVMDYGALPNTAQSSQAAFMAALSDAKAAGGGDVYVPAGTYLASAPIQTGLNGVTLRGDGRDVSVIVANSTSRRILDVRESTDFTIRDIGFDANGCQSFGGIVLYSCRQVTIQDTRYFDSHLEARIGIPPATASDISAWTFGRSAILSEDLTFKNNEVLDLHCEFDSLRNVRILNNKFIRPFGTAGVGIFSLQRDTIPGRETAAEGITIQDNKLAGISNARIGIAVHLDPPVHTDGTPLNNIDFRDIKILDNELTMDTPNVRCAHAIRIGAVNNAYETVGIVFDGLSVERNVIRIAPGLNVGGNEIMQWMTSRPFSGGPDFYFKNAHSKDNTAYYSGTKPFFRNYASNDRVFPA